ncbi:HAD family hydrolase [Streptomyces sp. NPDC050546]|uniref:HAD family hydrolase n=1 Tax=Streptomyces sp. NPDC050546 TaxID=3365628 RepID=UPI0037A08472
MTAFHTDGRLTADAHPGTAAAERGPVAAVACDIDGTLTATSSALAVSQALGVSPAAHARLYRAYRAGELYGDGLRKALLEVWSGATRDRLEETFAAVPLREGASRFLGAVRAAGLPLVLITSSVQEYADAMGRRLGAAMAHGAGHVRYGHDGVLTGLELDAADDTAMAALKGRQLRTAAHALGLEAERVLVVGNGTNDLGLFAATPYSVLIDPTGNSPLRPRTAYAVPGLDEAADYVLALTGTALS